MYLTGALGVRLASICRQKGNEMLDYVNVTPVLDPIVNWAVYAPYEDNRPARDTFSTHTRLTGSKKQLFELFASKTGADAPTSFQDAKLNRFSPRVPSLDEQTSNQRRSSQEVGSNAEIDRIAKQRIRLMATKYAGNNASAEIVARLEILNKRLLDRSPRVSQDQVKALEEASETLSRISMAREERSRRLGILA